MSEEYIRRKHQHHVVKMYRPSLNPDTYLDNKNRCLYMRADSYEIYMLDFSDYSMYYCCTTKKRLDELTEEEKRPKKKVAD